MILGFILGSIFNIFPGIPSLPQAPVCLLTFAAGFTAIYFLSKKEAQGTNYSRFVFQECSESSSADRLFAYACHSEAKGEASFFRAGEQMEVRRLLQIELDCFHSFLRWFISTH